MVSKLVLEYKFTFHQKLVLLISVAALILMIVTLTIEIFELNDLLLFYAISASYPLLIVLAFIKRGFLIKGNQLFKSYFFLGIKIFNTEIDMSFYPKVSVLKFKKQRKLPWFSIARPDIATEFNSFEVNILNESHTKRKIIMELKKDKLIKPTLDFLTSNTRLVYETYNPKTRRRPRRRNKLR